MIDFRAIHDKSRFHKEAVQASRVCGCFSCLRTFPPTQIKEWSRSNANDVAKTCAVCPYCSVDAVLPDTENLTAEVLSAMKRYWFQAVRPGVCPHCGAESDGKILYSVPLQARCRDCGKLWEFGEGATGVAGRDERPRA